MEAKLIDSMGTDLTVVNAARVSFHKEHDIFTFKKDVEKGSDEGLIKYLATHNHWTPFSHVQITMREKVPIFVARQRFKHMVGFTYNEVSRRYVDDPPEFYTPDVWRKAPGENKKQGSSEEVIEGWENIITDFDGEPYQTNYVDIKKRYQSFMEQIAWYYQDMIDHDVAPEMARMILPQSMYTEYYVTGSLAAWARAYKLRTDPHAQKEIQDLAVMWGDVIGGMDELEHSWKALTDGSNT